ncbi:Acyl-CoA dehydrogenase [Rasamsonia emersonii CBS 393.64]|uniref:Acyl-CoA dehydrogenase n=1 Tax=Rasamsonia emersonii (strain ATCC 16479 / CBS 393.64 / IMI 116815) TaxID=1408163 RepID=A0A0F4Z2A4_RASE3|nr:Acyl-CoA dehydrogenase [Rasamsonia emersonii CBS 393.64]KKA24018.1 Acyl-CoA dehydrogenase [Rasamsonia emersonii CBS 393.64]
MTRRPVTAPYSEPLLPQLDIDNPYYTDLHRNLRAYVRDYVESSIAPYAQDWEAAGEVPESVRLRHCALGFNIVHPLTTPEDAAGLSLPGNVPRDRWDTWCSLIVTDELARVGFIGVIWGLGGGNAIGCPPIARFGSPEQRRRWLPGVAKGELRFCLGITEPDGEDSSSGTSLIYLDRTLPTSAQPREERETTTSSTAQRNGSPTASGPTTAPLRCALADQDERESACLSFLSTRRASLASECTILESMRALFDSPESAPRTPSITPPSERRSAPLSLREQVIQSKIFKFGLLIEPVQSFMEQLVYIIESSKDRPDHEVNIGGMTALLKVMATRALEKCVREAQQIMGGAGYNKAGKGARVEQISRDVRVHVVGGGSEEILMGLALQEEMKALRVRQKALKNAAKL